MSIFEKATRSKIRFESAKGLLSVEQLWDLPLTGKTSLNSVAVSVNRQIQDTQQESFVDDNPKADPTLNLMMEVVKHIISVKKAEKEKADKAREKRQERQRLLELLARKEDEELEKSSKEDILKKLEALDESE